MQDIIVLSDQILVYVNSIVFWVCAIVFWAKSKKSELKSQKRFFIGISFFFIFWGIMRIMFIFSNYYYEIDLSLYSFYWKIASTIGIGGLLSILIVLEIYMVKSKFIFSIITFIGLLLAIILPINGTEISGARLATYIFLPTGALSILGLYIYLYIKLSGRARHETGIIAWGLTLIFLGYTLTIELIKHIFNTELISPIASVVMICGALLYTTMYYFKKA
ncbi:MAG: hypothetical protein ACTSYZ_09180 [Candidatus Helarchaeota archaeon]